MNVCASTTETKLCRLSGRTCGACCFGARVSRNNLTRQLRRQTAVLKEVLQDGLPETDVLKAHELQVRGRDRLWGRMLALPWIGVLLQNWLYPRLTCAYLVFEDPDETRIGCALHPSRWNGDDRRTATAFHKLPGFACGAATFFCKAADVFKAADPETRELFDKQTEDLDWFDYSAAAPRFCSDDTQKGK